MGSSHIDANNKKVFLFDFDILLGELQADSAKSWESLFRDIIGRDEKIIIYSTTAHTETMQDTLATLNNPKLSRKIKFYSEKRPPNFTDTAYPLPSFEIIFEKCFSSTDSTPMLPAAKNVTYISDKPTHIDTATEKGHKTILVESLVDGMPKSFPSQIEEQIGNLFASHSGQQNEKKAVGDTKLTSSKALDAFAGEEEKKAAPTAEEKKVDDTNPTPSKTFDDYFTSKIFSDPLLDEKYVKFSQENYDKWQTDSDAHAALSAYFLKPTESKDAPELCIEVTETFKEIHWDLSQPGRGPLKKCFDLPKNERARRVGTSLDDMADNRYASLQPVTQQMIDTFFPREQKKMQEEVKAATSVEIQQPEDAAAGAYWRLDIHDVVATVKKRYGTKDPDWLKNRFEQGSENGFAYFEGSTYARNSDVNNESVLDAVTARIDRKDEGDCIGVRRLATFDGLGHGFDAKESASISQENKIMSRALDQELSQQSGINLKDAFLKASARAFNERKQLGKEEFNSGCAVSLAVLEHDKKTEKMKLQLVKSGDTMTLVLDSKTLAIKKILPACQRITPDETKNTKKIPSPAHLANANPDLVKSQTFDVDPNDFIVELTDGFTDELQCESKIVTSKGLSRLETQLTPHALDVPLAALKRKGAPWNEYDIAAAIAVHTERVQDQKRTGQLTLQEDFFQWLRDHGDERNKKNDLTYYLDLIKQDPAYNERDPHGYTFEQYFSWLAKNPAMERDSYPAEAFHNDLNKYLVHVQNCFAETRGIPLEKRSVKGLLHQIQRRPALTGGDCATVAIMRVPDPDVELVRALINSPDYGVKVRPQLIATIIKKKEKDRNFDLNAWQTRIVDTLRAEFSIAPGSRGNPNTMTRTPVYTEDQLSSVNIANLLEQKTNNVNALEDLQRKIQKDNQDELIHRLQTVEENKPYTVEERNQIFVEFWRSNNFILVHKNKRWDSIFGLKNTATWRNTMEKVREDAVRQLGMELQAIKKACDDFMDNDQKYTQYDKETFLAVKKGWEITDQLKLLHKAREMPIFNEHRNNSIFAGAFSRTEAVKWIDARIEENNEKLKQLQKKYPVIFTRAEPPASQNQ